MNSLDLFDGVDNLNQLVSHLNPEIQRLRLDAEAHNADLSKVDFQPLYNEFYKLLSLALMLTEDAENYCEVLFKRGKAYFRDQFECEDHADIPERYKMMRIELKENALAQREAVRALLLKLKPSDM